MKKISVLLITVGILLIACSKKKEVIPVNSVLVTKPGDSVLINGTKYPTQIIDGQTWTSLNYRGPGGVYYGLGNTDPADTIIFGKLYASSELSSITLPAGWRLPLNSDYNKLLANLGGVETPSGAYRISETATFSLMSTSGWESFIITKGSGTNSSGFNAYPAGIFDGNNFVNAGLAAWFWNANYNTGDGIYGIYNNGNLSEGFGASSIWKCSLRFVKDN